MKDIIPNLSHRQIIPLTTYTSKYEIAADFCVFRRTLGQSELIQRLVAQQLKYRSLNIRQPVIMHNYARTTVLEGR